MKKHCFGVLMLSCGATAQASSVPNTVEPPMDVIQWSAPVSLDEAVKEVEGKGFKGSCSSSMCVYSRPTKEGGVEDKVHLYINPKDAQVVDRVFVRALKKMDGQACVDVRVKYLNTRDTLRKSRDSVECMGGYLIFAAQPFSF